MDETCGEILPALVEFCVGFDLHSKMLVGPSI